MRQAFWILTLAGAVAVALTAPRGLLQAATGPKDAIAQAREQIAKNELTSAADALEDALGDAQGDDRTAILDLLKQTYKGLIDAAKAAGKTQDAEVYSDDLAILEAQPSPAAAPAPPTAPAPAAAPPTSPTAPAPAAAALPRAPAPGAESQAPPPRVEPTLVPTPSEMPTLPDLTRAPTPTPNSDPKPAATVTVPRNDQIPDPGAVTPPDRGAEPDGLPPLDAPVAGPRVAQPARRDDELRTASNSTKPERIDEPDATLNAPVDASKKLADADALFTQKKYDEAGAVYAALAAENRLPSARKKVWAYCRWSAVVARINAHPRSAKEWDDIEREIQSVEVLTPGNWYGEYLKDRVSAARRGERRPGRQGRLVVRGAAPEEPEPAPAPRRAPTAPAEPATGVEPLDLPSASAPPPAVAAPGQAPSWQVLETSSFRIHHTDPALAEQAAEAAEATRARQGTRWGSKAVQAPWSPRCDIYLYPTARDFARMTGQPETSPGFSTMGVSGAQVVSRRVNLRADHPQMIPAILPHEVTHVVLADVFSDQQIPRWADEGMAVLAEPASEQAGRADDLQAPLAESRVFKLSQLMAIDYPEAKEWNLFYAQSVSLTQFLVRQGTAAQFVAFVKAAQREGVEAAIRSVYKYDGFDDLETRWLDFAVKQSSRVATTDPATPDRK